ncbi:nucleoside-diphosphate sugar epimerase [Mycobacterium kubicae]|uniref:Nucleoside-diphosphate sugar epimerase n=1 Tax=Mycobacterium kubicae TaxID=120959 RepID=A0AAX1JE47_9MYCO|nr:TIGR01777 family oxidoreductase [Mycobacterium kubicae]MCV7098434.1 TIGR01777 family protein [Mycobacterium kubicae]ORW02143.1 nucleoside-diphosphate sugar epimerase [Mycobacterium kubicae]QNI11267.1 TIGR01777 family protein [Mycobacterium kubicae]QPI39481.1 TIGR01777 family protein [Mycobacterium kubicae]GFG64079.1 nucleoside-diphosphate sugar epimerase [Mycobacterium kubicae]
MGLVYESVVDAPRDEVFAWHTRPGAFTRLSPPWQPMKLVTEAESVEDGRATLALPGGLRWVAEHQADSYDPPRRFVDAIGGDGLASLPARVAVNWRHTHEFEEVGTDQTRVIDRVATPVPARALRPMFAYRHRQLADDLAAHRLAAAHGLAPATIAITGSSGLVGSALAAFLSTGGHRVIRLVRGAPNGSAERRWDTDDPDPALLAGVDAVIHLAGASIAGRFTDKHRKAIRDSRIGPTRRLAEAVALTPNGPRALISASAIGYYGYDRGDATLTEDSERGDGFLADVVVDWEDATSAAEQAGVRVVRVRTGIVQSPRGGTLRLMRPLFGAGLGGRLGAGRQWLSWIGIDDLIDVYHRALWDTDLSGAVNAVAPQPVRNSDYTRTLARVLRRPAVLPVPPLGPRILLGQQGARELALASQRVLPERLTRTGHRFRQPDLQSALRHLLGRNR